MCPREGCGVMFNLAMNQNHVLSVQNMVVMCPQNPPCGPACGLAMSVMPLIPV